MQNPSLTRAPADDLGNDEDSNSAVSWAAILGGTFTAVAVALILITFGSGVGFASVSPWSHEGMSAKHFTYAAAMWLIIVQWGSSGLGGYLTGRLRTKWIGVHTHEVFFRDTAHGFLTWAVATVLSFVLVIGMASSAIGGAAHMASAGARGHSAMMDNNAPDPMAYSVDSLFRAGKPSAAPMDADTKMESTRILMKGVRDGGLSDADKNYLAQLVAARAGLSQPDAQKKVDETIVEIRRSADEARKVAGSIAIFTFLSMLIGAFIASAAAALGGQQRDEPYPHTM